MILYKYIGKGLHPCREYCAPT